MEAQEYKGRLPGMLHGGGWFFFDPGPSFADVEALQGTRVLFVLGEVERHVLVHSVRLDPNQYKAILRPAKDVDP